MKWTTEAESAVKKAPFFVRKKIRTRVEKEARERGRPVISLEDVHASQRRFLSGMEKEIRGYRVEGCFGHGGCPNRVLDSANLLEKLETLLQSENILDFLKQNVKNGLKFHHEFSVTLAECPNACSQPQIRDVGIIGALAPTVTDESCSQCKLCLDACRENAVECDEREQSVQIDPKLCLYCGQCVNICPTGAISAGEKGYRVLLAGKLGRRPKLGMELPGIFNHEEVLEIVRACVSFYKKNSRDGKRFAEIFQDSDFEKFSRSFGKPA